MAMNKEEALFFLDKNSPLPDDVNLTKAVIGDFDQVRRLLIREPSLVLLKKYMQSFGNGDGFGVYQLSDDALRSHLPHEAVSAILNGLKSDVYPVVKWCMHFTAEFPSQEYRPHLHSGLTSADVDMRTWAAMGLSSIYVAALDSAAVRSQIAKEKDETVFEILSEMVQL